MMNIKNKNFKKDGYLIIPNFINKVDKKKFINLSNKLELEVKKYGFCSFFNGILKRYVMISSLRLFALSLSPLLLGLLKSPMSSSWNVMLSLIIHILNIYQI